MKKDKILKDEQGNEISSPRLSDNPSEEGEVKVSIGKPLEHAIRGDRLSYDSTEVDWLLYSMYMWWFFMYSIFRILL